MWILWFEIWNSNKFELTQKSCTFGVQQRLNRRWVSKKCTYLKHQKGDRGIPVFVLQIFLQIKPFMIDTKKTFLNDLPYFFQFFTHFLTPLLIPVLALEVLQIPNFLYPLVPLRMEVVYKWPLAIVRACDMNYSPYYV